MNIPLSLLIYNPIEAYTMILLCDVITGNRTIFNKCLIFKLFVFSSFNLVIEELPYIWYGEWEYVMFNAISAYIMLPIVLKYFYNLFCKNRITIKQSIIAMFIISIFAMIIPIIFDLVFKTSTLFYNNNSLHEFIINFIILFLQIILYKFILAKRNFYEKHYERFRRENDK